jgi:DNA polymerase
MDLDISECERIIDIYRNANPRIKRLWYEGEQSIESMHGNKSRWFGREGVVLIEGRLGVKLPSGLYISYPQLHRYTDPNTMRQKWAYKDDTGIVDIYGGKLTENIVQALARIVVMSQLLRISKKFRVALTVHDSIIALAREEQRDEARAFVESCMRWVPPWAEGLPINCESKWGYNYGEMRED